MPFVDNGLSDAVAKGLSLGLSNKKLQAYLDHQAMLQALAAQRDSLLSQQLDLRSQALDLQGQRLDSQSDWHSRQGDQRDRRLDQIDDSNAVASGRQAFNQSRLQAGDTFSAQQAQGLGVDVDPENPPPSNVTGPYIKQDLRNQGQIRVFDQKTEEKLHQIEAADAPEWAKQQMREKVISGAIPRQAKPEADFKPDLSPMHNLEIGQAEEHLRIARDQYHAAAFQGPQQQKAAWDQLTQAETASSAAKTKAAQTQEAAYQARGAHISTPSPAGRPAQGRSMGAPDEIGDHPQPGGRAPAAPAAAMSTGQSTASDDPFRGGDQQRAMSALQTARQRFKAMNGRDMVPGVEADEASVAEIAVQEYMAGEGRGQ